MPPSEKQLKLPVQQLAILSVCRFAEPITLTSVFPYLPEMIESFDVPKNDVAKWAGVMSLVFSLSQAVTSIPWGRASDQFGRKPTILLALFCVMSTSLLFGFSQSLTWAILARAFTGASTGTVGIIRTTVAELVPQKSLQPMAFSIMPMIWALGSSFGPIVGGVLAIPARQYPALFGGNAFLERFPFLLPNLAGAIFFAIGLITGTLFLKETLESRRNRPDWGLKLGRALTQPCKGRARRPMLTSPRVPDNESASSSSHLARKHNIKPEAAPSWAEVFTPQSNLNVIAYTLLAFHAVTFDQLVPVFLHLPYEQPELGENLVPPFKFGGGFGLNHGRIGLLFTAMGVFGMVAQFTVFPYVTRRFGVLRSFRVTSFFFPIMYLLVPYTVLLPTDGGRQTGIFILMIVKSLLAVFGFPCTTILLTNSASSVRILGTLNGVSVATSAIGRATGPFISGSSLSWGAKRGYVILPWLILAAFAVAGHVVTWWLIEMDGPSSSAMAAAEDAQDEEGSQDDDNLLLLPNQGEVQAEQAKALMNGDETLEEYEASQRKRQDETGYGEQLEAEDHEPLLKSAPETRHQGSHTQSTERRRSQGLGLNFDTESRD